MSRLGTSSLQGTVFRVFGLMALHDDVMTSIQGGNKYGCFDFDSFSRQKYLGGSIKVETARPSSGRVNDRRGDE